MSAEPMTMLEESEAIAGDLFDEIKFVCAVLVQVDIQGGNKAFGENEQYRRAIEIARIWTGTEGVTDGNANGNNNRQEQEAQD